ncbi:hypothetical protein AC578_2251 [Pseudocercospora eumusae]|uniref:Uncharacterized protein n=1 Tax=Pseudocercospora eumusae TaxID=321146 RepID=A0A139GUM4_9PEZI|nr:hypothetical protein AC578_2251 [Pseudocercospora eumusae]
MLDTPSTLDPAGAVFWVIWLMAIIIIYELRKCKKENRNLRLRIDEYMTEIEWRENYNREAGWSTYFLLLTHCAIHYPKLSVVYLDIEIGKGCSRQTCSQSRRPDDKNHLGVTMPLPILVTITLVIFSAVLIKKYAELGRTRIYLRDRLKDLAGSPLGDSDLDDDSDLYTSDSDSDSD